MGGHNTKAKMQGAGEPSDHIADVTATFAAGAIDTGTDMTAAEAAALVADIAALIVAVNAINAAMADWNMTKDS